MTITKEVAQKIATDMAKHLKSDGDFDTFTMTVGGITLSFQRLPEGKNVPAKLGMVFNPVINGKTARKGKYFWDAESFNAYVEALNDIKDVGTLMLKIMAKINPKGNVKTTNKKADHSY